MEREGRGRWREGGGEREESGREQKEKRKGGMDKLHCKMYSPFLTLPSSYSIIHTHYTNLLSLLGSVKIIRPHISSKHDIIIKVDESL